MSTIPPVAGMKFIGYGETKKVAPKEPIQGITGCDGTDYIGVPPDPEKDVWFTNLVKRYGYANLCRWFPYQPLRVNKETAMLEPCNPCQYAAKATNMFHVWYQMILKSMQEKQPSAPASLQYREEELHGMNISALVDQPANGTSYPMYDTKCWHDAYHHEVEPTVYANLDMVNRLVMNEIDKATMYTLSNKDMIGTMDSPPAGYHPNPTVNRYASVAASQPPIMSGWTQPSTIPQYRPMPMPMNPYTYNPTNPGFNNIPASGPNISVPIFNYDADSVFADAWEKKILKSNSR